MLFNRRRVALFLVFLFIMMTAIFAYTNALIEDQTAVLEEDLLRLQASMVAWVASGFQGSASLFQSEFQAEEDAFTDQQFQILTSMIVNSPTSDDADFELALQYGQSAFGWVRPDGSLHYSGEIPEAVVLEAFSKMAENSPAKRIQRVELSEPLGPLSEAANYVFYFSWVEKTGATLFTGGKATTFTSQTALGVSALDHYLNGLYADRGYEGYYISKSGRILSAFDTNRIGKQLSENDEMTGISLFQRMVDNPSKLIQVRLKNSYDAFTLPLEDSYVLLLKPSEVKSSSERTTAVLSYGLIGFNLAIVTAVLMFLRKNHAFVIEKISLTELQVQKRRRAAGFIVIVIVLAFALMILLINGLLNIQLTQLDFDKKLHRFSEAMAVQYGEAYTSLEQQNLQFTEQIEESKAKRLERLYLALRNTDSEWIRRYTSTSSSSQYVVNWMRVSQTTRELINSQYHVDLTQVNDFVMVDLKSESVGMTLIGYDADKLNVWVIQALESQVTEAKPSFAMSLLDSGIQIEGFFALYQIERANAQPKLMMTMPDTPEIHAHAAAIGEDLYHDAVKETIGIQKISEKEWVLFAPTSDPLSGDLKRASYGFTRFMSMVTLLLVAVVVGGWWHYGRKGPL